MKAEVLRVLAEIKARERIGKTAVPLSRQESRAVPDTNRSKHTNN